VKVSSISASHCAANQRTQTALARGHRSFELAAIAQIKQIDLQSPGALFEPEKRLNRSSPQTRMIKAAIDHGRRTKFCCIARSHSQRRPYGA